MLPFVSNAGNSPTEEALTGNGTAQVSHNVELSWNSNGSGVMGFYVYRSSRTGGPYTKINTESDPNPGYSDDSVESGQTYYYVTTAVDSGGLKAVIPMKFRR